MGAIAAALMGTSLHHNISISLIKMCLLLKFNFYKGVQNRFYLTVTVLKVLYDINILPPLFPHQCSLSANDYWDKLNKSQ